MTYIVMYAIPEKLIKLVPWLQSRLIILTPNFLNIKKASCCCTYHVAVLTVVERYVINCGVLQHYKETAKPMWYKYHISVFVCFIIWSNFNIIFQLDAIAIISLLNFIVINFYHIYLNTNNFSTQDQVY